MTTQGQEEIIQLVICMTLYSSLTGDIFMQEPFWKASPSLRPTLENEFFDVINACAIIGIRDVVVPLVDNGSLENFSQIDYLLSFCLEHTSFFAHKDVRIIFESDQSPDRLAHFIHKLPPNIFGIN